MSEQREHRHASAMFPSSTAFTDAPFAEALAGAHAEQRWLLIDLIDTSNLRSWATAYTTWRDGDLLAWIEKYAIAVRVDARADAATARALQVDVSSLPMIILFRESKERLRIPGRVSPAALLKQLVQIDVAEDNVALQRRMLKDPERDMADRDGLAEALLRAGSLEEALEHYDWLWQYAANVDPQMAGVRVSFMARKIGELCQRLPAAHARFAQHRDVAAGETFSDDQPRRHACLDYLVLNEALGETARTVEWFDGLNADQRRALSDGLVDLRLVPLLLERQRWADAGAMIRDPLEQLELAERVARITGGLYRRVAELYRSLVAAGRHEDAAALRDAALRIEDGPAMRKALC